MMHMSKPLRGLVSAAIFAVSFAIAYGLRGQVHTVGWPVLGGLIGLSVYFIWTIWTAVRHGPRALLHR